MWRVNPQESFIPASIPARNQNCLPNNCPPSLSVGILGRSVLGVIDIIPFSLFHNSIVRKTRLSHFPNYVCVIYFTGYRPLKDLPCELLFCRFDYSENTMKYLIITGAAGGMGWAAARMLTQSGYLVFGLDLREPDPLPGLQYIRTDLTDPESIHQALNRIRSTTDRISGIIHMAGIYDLDSLIEISDTDFQKIFEVNLFAVYRVNQAFFPLLEKGGRIIITTSELAPLDPLPFTGIYAVTKSALDKYACSLRMELQLLGYYVIVLRPGAVDTAMLSDSVRALDDFCSGTRLYPDNAARFHQIVDHIESRNVDPSRIASILRKALHAKHPRQVYCVNRNPLLLLMNLLPSGLQSRILRRVLARRP